MKEILLKFLTKRGEEAYAKVEAEGKAQSRLDRRIAKSVARDTVIQKSPLVVKIKIKIKRLAVQVQLDKQVVEALKKFGAKENKDFEIEVTY